jgi:pyruvate/2-oxoglutarate dehydrogenase complex dihydrolipoamide acyltransferase (E2) component
MPLKVIMPQLGESVTEGTISKWLKAIGDDIKEFEPLLEVNTDKVDSEIPSPGDGVLLSILVGEGTTVTAGTTLAWIGERGEQIPEDEDTTKALTTARTEKPTPVPVEPHQVPKTAFQIGRNKDLGFISPVVAKISQEQNVDLTKVPGTGQGGRITKKDILHYIELKKSQQPETPAPQPLPGSAQSRSMLPGELLPHSIVRRSIADHMVKSKHISPHVSTVMEANLSYVVAHRQANKEAFEKDGVNLTFTAYFISAAIAGLKSQPIVNSSWLEEGIQIHKQINFGSFP